MPKKTPPKPLSPLLEVDKELDEKLCKCISDFSGQVTVLESAIGTLVIGQHYGMEVVRMAHSPATLRKYQKVLDIKYADHCPETTPLTRKSVGVKVAEKLGGVWKVITGKVKVEGKGEVTASTAE